MKANKDKGTSVGFTKFSLFEETPTPITSTNTVCKEHEFIEVELSVTRDSKIVYSTLCRKCGKEKLPIDFKIKENLSVINKQEWEDIEKDFYKSFEYQKCNDRYIFQTYMNWLKENYIAPEKKIP